MSKIISIIGSDGFIGKNFSLFLKSSSKKFKVYEINRTLQRESIIKLINTSDIIINCAGINRSKSKSEFHNNYKICQFLIDNLVSSKKKKLIHISSTKVFEKNLYGKTKKKAEKELISSQNPNLSIRIIRCPNVFGKWSKPNYNSVVATFCYNVIRNKKNKIFGENNKIQLIYIDDLCEIIMNEINTKKNIGNFIKIDKKFIKISTPKIILDKIKLFQKYRYQKLIPDFKDTFSKNLYSTFLTFLPKKLFKYSIEKKSDKRGTFVEFLKTISSGQISYIKINSKLSRGNHYHMSKVEKFLLLNGRCKFEFKNMKNPNENINFIINSKNTEIMETIPGWLHSVKNLSNYPIYLIIWANEIFDKLKPDTYKE